MKIIKLRLVHPTNSEEDVVLAINPETIEFLTEASPVARRHRPELSTFIQTKFGQYGVRETMLSIIEKIEGASL